MKRAWALISAAVWIVAFLGVWFIAHQLEVRTGERHLFSPHTVGIAVATIVTGSIAIFGFAIVNAMEREEKPGGPTSGDRRTPPAESTGRSP